jgi:hypothetical protein
MEESFFWAPPVTWKWSHSMLTEQEVRGKQS